MSILEEGARRGGHFLEWTSTKIYIYIDIHTLPLQPPAIGVREKEREGEAHVASSSDDLQPAGSGKARAVLAKLKKRRAGISLATLLPALALSVSVWSASHPVAFRARARLKINGRA